MRTSIMKLYKPKAYGVIFYININQYWKQEKLNKNQAFYGGNVPINLGMNVSQVFSYIWKPHDPLISHKIKSFHITPYNN